MSAPSSILDPGKRLRAERERLHLSTRAVERLSERIAQKKKNPTLQITHNWLSNVENGKFKPGFSKLYSLSLIYQCDIEDLLALFGLDIRNLNKERALITLPNTHLLRPTARQLMPIVKASLNFHKDISLKHTNLVSRMFGDLSDFPIFLLQQANPRYALYGYVGTEDYTLDPVVRPGTIVQIDTRQTKVSRDFVSRNEYERPIYFTELRDNQYACSWCQLDGNYLFLIPSPQSRVGIRQFRYPQDAEIIGRVTVITMRISSRLSVHV
ncbi:MAG TPA: helix-turn-helix transcriptional regulator [Terriglobales bacterium]|nr:helix-turn-helix transcriptional regulator [Terriglobales bacterium]